MSKRIPTPSMDIASTPEIDGEDPAGPPQQYYASQEAICSRCGRHVDLCKHGADGIKENDWV